MVVLLLLPLYKWGDRGAHREVAHDPTPDPTPRVALARAKVLTWEEMQVFEEPAGWRVSMWEWWGHSSGAWLGPILRLLFRLHRRVQKPDYSICLFGPFLLVFFGTNSSVCCTRKRLEGRIMEGVDRSHHPKPHFLISVVPRKLNSILKSSGCGNTKKGSVNVFLAVNSPCLIKKQNQHKTSLANYSFVPHTFVRYFLT